MKRLRRKRTKMRPVADALPAILQPFAGFHWHGQPAGIDERPTDGPNAKEDAAGAEDLLPVGLRNISKGDLAGGGADDAAGVDEAEECRHVPAADVGGDAPI